MLGGSVGKSRNEDTGLTALVLRYTYPNAPRLNACIEQLVFSAELPDLGEPIRLNVPFDLYLAHSADAELGP